MADTMQHTVASAYGHLPNVLKGDLGSAPHEMMMKAMFAGNGARAALPQATELGAALVFFAMWVVLRKLSFKYVLTPCAKAMGAPDALTQYKWSVLAWNGVFHTWSTLWLLNWLPQHRWYYDTEFLWERILEPHPQVMELEFKAFYMLQLGYHMQSIIWHFFEERRPDFVTMMVHHIVTVMLIVGSYISSYARIGMLVLLVHDASDVFVCLTKCFHMCNWKRASHGLFVLMVIVWAYTRLYLYPFWVIGSCWSYPESARFGFIWWIFVLMMAVLLVLHIYWFHLFIKMAMGIAKHGSGKDLTENKEAMEEAERDAARKEGDVEDPQAAYDPSPKKGR